MQTKNDNNDQTSRAIPPPPPGVISGPYKNQRPEGWLDRHNDLASFPMPVADNKGPRS